MSDDGQNARNVRMTMAFCAFTALCEGIDLQAAGVAAGGIIGEFSPAADQLGNFFSASTFGLFCGAVVGGRMADVIGRKHVLTVSVALFGLFSLVTPLAWDMSTLTLARLVTGLGLGGAMPTVLALVSETASAKRQSASVAMIYAATPFGGALASLVSVLIAASHWRWIFVLGGILPLLLAPLMLFGLQESAGFRALQQRSALARDAGTPVLQSGSFAALFGGGRAVITLLLWVSFFLALLLLYLLLNWLPTFLVSDGMSRSQAAGAQIGFNVGGGIAALLIGHSLGGRLRNGAVVLTFVALPLLLLALAKAPAEVFIIMMTVFLLGCAIIAAQAFLYSMAPVAYPIAIRGVGVGAAVAVGRIGSIVGPKLGGLLKGAGHGPGRLLMDLLPIVVLGSLCALCFAWYTRRVNAAA
jgi:AAHS family 3-hydroxyphenylpropionic acid transporter